MNILHTSDWHLGCSLYGRRRYREHDAFLAWLLETIRRRNVEVLLVAGDIFDSTMPSNRALTQYYRFLYQVSSTGCNQVVIIGGNHDSPSLLAAPRDLLKNLNIHVVAAISDDPGDEIIAIDGAGTSPRLIVCAVPYLRDREIRTAEAGESFEDKGRKLIDGIAAHYHEVCTRAQRLRRSPDIPLVVMGHLFAAGAQSHDDDGERELYVGSLARFPLELLPDDIDYLALGHLHRSQCIGGEKRFRYSGSPLPMSFAGAHLGHCVCLLSFSGRTATPEPIPVPVFQPLVSIRGDLTTIMSRLDALREETPAAWIEVHYTGTEMIGDLQRQIMDAVAGSEVVVLRVVDNRVMARIAVGETVRESLDSLSPEEVFRRCLESHDVPEAQRPPLLATFREALRDMYEEDRLAE